MAEIVGRATCPICGEPSQDVKVNKNNKIYCYCDNGCKWQLNSKNSRAVLAALRSGRNIMVDKFGMISAVSYKQPDCQPARRDELEEDLDI
jgi:hypothetical protein